MSTKPFRLTMWAQPGTPTGLHLREDEMTTMTPAEADAVWGAIDDQRTRTADLLEQAHGGAVGPPVAVPGWTVRHVAAHLTLQQQRVRDVAAFVAHNPGCCAA